MNKVFGQMRDSFAEVEKEFDWIKKNIPSPDIETYVEIHMYPANNEYFRLLERWTNK